jgi:hypothetical protein
MKEKNAGAVLGWNARRERCVPWKSDVCGTNPETGHRARPPETRKTEEKKEGGARAEPF